MVVANWGLGEVGANWGLEGAGCHINVENIYRSEQKRLGGCWKWSKIFFQRRFHKVFPDPLPDSLRK